MAGPYVGAVSGGQPAGAGNVSQLPAVGAAGQQGAVANGQVGIGAGIGASSGYNGNVYGVYPPDCRCCCLAALKGNIVTPTSSQVMKTCQQAVVRGAMEPPRLRRKRPADIREEVPGGTSRLTYESED